MLCEYSFLLLMVIQFIGGTFGQKLANDTQKQILNVPKNISSVANSSAQNNVKLSVPDESLNKTFNINVANDKTHMGRENVTDDNVHAQDELYNSSKVYIETTSANIVEPSPKYDVGSEKNDGKSVVPKKGVEYENKPTILNQTQNIHPTIKVHESLKKNQTGLTSKLSGVNVIHQEEKVSDLSNYFLPIVALLLLVPLIGILFMIFYKHGSEWWQHRHYRRMDFLIDGMYNN